MNDIRGHLNVIKTFLLFLISLFPTLPTIVDNSSFLSSVADVISFANTFCVLSVVLGCIGILFVVYNIKTIWAAVMWVVRKIPGVS